MSASPDDLLILLNKWKANGNSMGIKLSHDGQTNLEINMESARAFVGNADKEEIVFLFGDGLAKGSLTIPLHKGIVFWDIIDPSDPPFFESYDTNSEACIKFTWLGYWATYRCVVCALPKPKTQS